MMEKPPEDLFESETDLSASTSQELLGLRARLTAPHGTEVIARRLSPQVVAALGVVLVVSVIGVMTWAWTRRSPPQAVPPAAGDIVPPHSPPDPAATARSAKTPNKVVASTTKRPGRPRPVLPASTTLSPPSAANPATIDYVVTTADRRGVNAAVERYREGFARLDAAAVRAVWPSADPRYLAREFGQLQEQQVDLHSCDLDIKYATASATCTGVAGAAPKTGSGNLRFDDRRWVFTLQRAGSDWVIQDVVIR